MSRSPGIRSVEPPGSSAAAEGKPKHGLVVEVQGLSGNIAGLHQSRAEYFILNGILDEAQRQLEYALKLTQGDHYSTSRIKERLRYVAELREQMESF